MTTYIMYMPRTHHISRYALARGFTLIEIIIAMSLLSLILLLVFSSLHAAGRNWEVSAEQIEMSDELRLASQFIRKNLAQAVPLIWINNEERKIAFTGESDELNFVVPLPSHRGGGGLSLLTLKTGEGEDENKLMLYYRMAIPDQQSFDFNLSDSEINSAVLAENIDSVEINYFGNEQDDDSDPFGNDPIWRDRWDIDDRLPLLVSLKINSVRPSVTWPEMLIAIRPQAEKGQPQFHQVAATD